MLDKENVGRTIALYRKMHGLTQKELADRLHISYQAVSKWEAGINMPSVEMLYEIAGILKVTVDILLNENALDNRQITYMDTGLNTQKLYVLKNEIKKLTSKDKKILAADYADAVLFQADLSGMKEPVFAMLNCVPGSKERYARELGYDEEICADTAANGMNHILQHGMKPMILKGMVVCGNNSAEQLYRMAREFQKVCEENDVMFAGMEVAAQPVNYRADEYKVSACLTGVQEKAKIIDGKQIREGNVLIGIQTEGINGTNYPIIKIMMDRKPELAYAKIDDEHYFAEEMMKANVAFVREIAALQEADCLHGVFRMRNHLLNAGPYQHLPEGLAACIDLKKIPILPFYRFLIEQDMIGKNVLPYHFHFGIGMVVAVPENRCEEAISVIRRSRNCWRIGEIKKNAEHSREKVWAEGKLVW
ncbi:MAG: helix-turn-helix domain-containing protein [Suilimivivens sp.]